VRSAITIWSHHRSAAAPLSAFRQHLTCPHTRPPSLVTPGLLIEPKFVFSLHLSGELSRSLREIVIFELAVLHFGTYGNQVHQENSAVVVLEISTCSGLALSA
jgi:hypothetical protein